MIKSLSLGGIFIRKLNLKKSHLLILLTVLIAVFMVGFAAEPKKMTIVADGKHQTLTTRALSVKGALAEAGIHLSKDDEYIMSTPKVANGSVIKVKRAVPITIVGAKKTKSIKTTKETVGEALKSAGISVDKYVSMVPDETPIISDMTITISPYSVQETTREEVVPYTVLLQPDNRLFVGQDVLEKEGMNGSKQITVRQIIVNDTVLREEVLAEQMLVSAQDATKRVGTRAMVQTSRGSERFTQVINMEATAYHPMDGNGLGITASGIMTTYGVVAVDPRVIPLGTRVFVPGYGDAIAADTGGAIIGNKIDLCMESYDECFEFGRRNVEVYILE